MLVSPPQPAEAADAAPELPAAGLPSASVDLSDGQLLQAYLQSKEEPAFGQLVSRFGSLVFAVALRSLRDRHAAEDVFQATFLVLARDARKIRSPESIAAWLHGTALRISRRALARRRDEVSLEQMMHPPSMISADNDPLLDEISERFEQQLVDDELQRLPAVYRAVLVLHILEGRTCEQTAAALGISVGAVRGRLQRGKQELKYRLMKRGVECSAVMGAIFLWQTLAEAAVQPPLIDAATRAGMAIAQGTPFAPGCSPEAVHLATQETAMLTTTKVLASTAVLFGALAVGWFAHAAGDGTTLPTHTSAVTTELHEVAKDVAPVSQPTALAFADPVVTHGDVEQRLNALEGRMEEFLAELRSIRQDMRKTRPPEVPDGREAISADNADQIQKLGAIAPHAWRLEWSPDGSKLAIVRWEQPVEILDAKTLSPINFLRDVVTATHFAFSANPDIIAWSDNQDSDVTILNLSTRTRIVVDAGGRQSKPEFSPDGTLLATGSYGTNANVWDARTGERKFQLAMGEVEGALTPVFSPDGSIIAIGHRNFETRLFESATGELLHSLHGPQSSQGLSFSPDGRVLAVGYVSGDIRLWNVADGRVVARQRSGAAEIYSVAWSPDGSLLVSCGRNGDVSFWDGKNLNPVASHESGEWVIDVTFTPDGRRLLTSGKSTSGPQAAGENQHNTGEVTVWGVPE